MYELWADPFFGLFLSVLQKGTADNNYTMDDLLEAMTSDIRYRLTDVTELVAGPGEHQAIHHVEDRTLTTSCPERTLFCLLRKFSIVDSPTRWTSLTEFLEHRARDFPEKLLNNIVAEHNIELCDTLGKAVADGDFASYYRFLVTEGLASHLVKRSGQGFVVDLRHMSRYPVRDRYLPYGACAVLGPDFDIRSIELGFTPKYNDAKTTVVGYDMIPHVVECRALSPEWNLAHSVFVASLSCYTTVADHLLHTHILSADSLLRVYYEYCGGSHGPGERDRVARFLFPFVYGTSNINTAAMKVLFGERNTVHRLFSFTYDGLTEFTREVIRNYARVPYPISLRGNGVETPFTRDIEKHWSIIRDFVTEFLVSCSETEIRNLYRAVGQGAGQGPGEGAGSGADSGAVLDFLTFNIFTVTVWHQHIGSISPYTFNPYSIRATVFKSTPFDLMCSQQESYHAMIVSAITSNIHYPKLLDVPTEQCGRLEGNWVGLQARLRETHFECLILQPQFIECSVAQ